MVFERDTEAAYKKLGRTLFGLSQDVERVSGLPSNVRQGVASAELYQVFNDATVPVI